MADQAAAVDEEAIGSRHPPTSSKPSGTTRNEARDAHKAALAKRAAKGLPANLLSRLRTGHRRRRQGRAPSAAGGRHAVHLGRFAASSRRPFRQHLLRRPVGHLRSMRGWIRRSRIRWVHLVGLRPQHSRTQSLSLATGEGEDGTQVLEKANCRRVPTSKIPEEHTVTVPAKLYSDGSLRISFPQ